MTLTVGTCSKTEPQCCNVGVARCVTCKTWYCSAQCQADHWPRHWRECLPLPDLEWLDVKDDETQEAVFVLKNLSSQTLLGESLDQVVGSANLQDITNKEPPKELVDKDSAQTKTIDICSADSSLHGKVEAPVKTTPGISEATDSVPSAVSVSLAPSVPDSEDKTSETQRKNPEEVVTTADLPSQSISIKDAIPTTAAVTRTTSQTSDSKSCMYTEAQFSSNLPHQILTKKVNEIVTPIDVIESPCDFIVRLADTVSWIKNLFASTLLNFIDRRRTCVSNCCLVLTRAHSLLPLTTGKLGGKLWWQPILMTFGK